MAQTNYKPMVSVIMPCYNHAEFVGEAIESVLAQSFENLELIIVEDASCDNSKAIIKNYQNKDSRIKAIFHEENKGIARTVNDAFGLASGEFIAFLSADDLWAPGKLEKQLDIFKKNKNLIIWGNAFIIDENSKQTGETLIRENHLARKRNGDIFEELLLENFICGQSMIFKKSYVGQIKFDENLKYLNDYKFALDLANKYRFYFLPETLTMYRIHGNNSHIAHKQEQYAELIILIEDYLHKYKEKISRRTKAKVYSILADHYSLLNIDRKRNLLYLFKGIVYNPFSLFGFFYLGKFILRQNNKLFFSTRIIFRKGKKIYYKLFYYFFPVK